MSCRLEMHVREAEGLAAISQREAFEIGAVGGDQLAVSAFVRVPGHGVDGILDLGARITVRPGGHLPHAMIRIDALHESSESGPHCPIVQVETRIIRLAEGDSVEMVGYDQNRPSGFGITPAGVRHAGDRIAFRHPDIAIAHPYFIRRCHRRDVSGDEIRGHLGDRALQYCARHAVSAVDAGDLVSHLVSFPISMLKG